VLLVKWKNFLENYRGMKTTGDAFMLAGFHISRPPIVYMLGLPYE